MNQNRVKTMQNLRLHNKYLENKLEMTKVGNSCSRTKGVSPRNDSQTSKMGSTPTKPNACAEQSTNKSKKQKQISKQTLTKQTKPSAHNRQPPEPQPRNEPDKKTKQTETQTKQIKPLLVRTAWNTHGMHFRKQTSKQFWPQTEAMVHYTTR